MKTAILVLSLFIAQSSMATSIVFRAGSMKPGNIMAKVDSNCADANAKLTQCQAWAAILKNESQGLLLMLQNSEHPDNIAIFEDAATMDDPRIKGMALTYLSRVKSSDDQGLIASALKAMFTEDSFLGNIAAKILRSSNSAPHEEVGKAFEEGRDSDLFSDPSRFPELFTNELFLDNSDIYQGMYLNDQERFVALDRHHSAMASSTFGGQGFMVSSPVADIISHFKTQTGLMPALPMSEIEPRINSLSGEMQKIADEMQHGDYSHMQRLQEIQLEMQNLSMQQLKWVQVGGDSSGLKDTNAFFMTSPQDENTVTGAILIKAWPIYQKTSIQYLNKREGDASIK